MSWPAGRHCRSRGDRAHPAALTAKSIRDWRLPLRNASAIEKKTNSTRRGPRKGQHDPRLAGIRIRTASAGVSSAAARPSGLLRAEPVAHTPMVTLGFVDEEYPPEQQDALLHSFRTK